MDLPSPAVTVVRNQCFSSRPETFFLTKGDDVDFFVM